MACIGCKKKRKPGAAPLQVASEPPDILEAARGLGTYVAKLTGALGIPHCAGCERRKRKLDAATPAWLRPFL